jgi:hypothetical protein
LINCLLTAAAAENNDDKYDPDAAVIVAAVSVSAESHHFRLPPFKGVFHHMPEGRKGVIQKAKNQELVSLVKQFAESGWDVIDVPAKEWLKGRLFCRTGGSI